jgi:hypothetical protein
MEDDARELYEERAALMQDDGLRRCDVDFYAGSPLVLSFSNGKFTAETPREPGEK